jgi:hypothetical protein
MAEADDEGNIELAQTICGSLRRVAHHGRDPRLFPLDATSALIVARTLQNATPIRSNWC